MAMLATGFFNGESCWYPLQRGHCELLVATAWLILVTPACLPFS